MGSHFEAMKHQAHAGHQGEQETDTGTVNLTDEAQAQCDAYTSCSSGLSREVMPGHSKINRVALRDDIVSLKGLAQRFVTLFARPSFLA